MSTCSHGNRRIRDSGTDAAACPTPVEPSAIADRNKHHLSHVTHLQGAQPPSGITFLAGLDRDLRTGLAAQIRALWTHHSTALECNTLTLGDTAFVLQEGLAVGGKPLKDHQEVVGHARAVDILYRIIDQRRAVTPDDLHTLHQAVQTGMVIDKFNPVGQWKVEQNGTTVLLTTGQQQWHDYTHPELVPALMSDLLQQLNALRPSGSYIDAYTDIHLGFTAIHPYADGNGRMARLLANVPVIVGGAPPVVVPCERRRDYITLMGDWSIARGAPRLGEPLVPGIDERHRLRAFFEEIYRPTQELLESFHKLQASRNQH